MGFSVSGSAAVIFIGFIVAFTTAYPVVADGYEQVRSAEDAADEDALAQRNTDIAITNTSYDAGNDTLVVEAENDGTTELALAATDLLVDNVYRTGNRSVEGDAGTGIWLPGETLTITVENVTARPNRVTLITEHGVSEGVSL